MALVPRCEPESDDALSQPKTLEQLGDDLRSGLAGLAECGQAWIEIRDKRLFREDHESFEDYLRANRVEAWLAELSIGLATDSLSHAQKLSYSQQLMDFAVEQR